MQVLDTLHTNVSWMSLIDWVSIGSISWGDTNESKFIQNWNLECGNQESIDTATACKKLSSILCCILPQVSLWEYGMLFNTLLSTNWTKI